MSANNVVWVMGYKGYWHVFYSGCFDKDPKEPDYKDKYYKSFNTRGEAILYAHGVVEKIDEFSLQEGHVGVEYGVCIAHHIDPKIEETFERIKPTLDALCISSKTVTNKDIQDFVGLVENMVGDLQQELITKENRIKERLCELEDNLKLQSYGDYSIGTLVEMAHEQLNELKGQTNDIDAVLVYTWDYIKPIKDVLRDHITAHKEIDKHNITWWWESLDKQLEKLEGKGLGFEEFKEIHGIEHPVEEAKKRKALGKDELKPLVLPDELKPFMKNRNVTRYLHNTFIDGFNKGTSYILSQNKSRDASGYDDLTLDDRLKDAMSKPAIPYVPLTKRAKRNDGCYQFTYCSECLAYPMGLGCPNLTKGPVQLKDEIKDGKTSNSS